MSNRWPVRIGIDLGGTKIEGLALAGDGREIDRRRVAAPRGSYAHTIRAIVDLVTAIESACPAEMAEPHAATVGVGVPGRFATTDELVELAKVARQHGGIYISHQRSESAQIIPSLDEVFAVAERADIPAEVWHLKTA